MISVLSLKKKEKKRTNHKEYDEDCDASLHLSTNTMGECIRHLGKKISDNERKIATSRGISHQAYFMWETIPVEIKHRLSALS